jgi:hypothetical protein
LVTKVYYLNASAIDNNDGKIVTNLGVLEHHEIPVVEHAPLPFEPYSYNGVIFA